MDLIRYLVLWSLMERPRECLTPTNPSSMAEIQGVINLTGHYICLPYAVEWKLQPWRLSLKQKSTLDPSSPSSPLPPSYFILTTTCHWIMGSREAVTEALTPQISSSIYVKKKKNSLLTSTLSFINLIPEFNPFLFLFVFFTYWYVFLILELNSFLPRRVQKCFTWFRLWCQWHGSFTKENLNFHDNAHVPYF